MAFLHRELIHQDLLVVKTVLEPILWRDAVVGQGLVHQIAAVERLVDQVAKYHRFLGNIDRLTVFARRSLFVVGTQRRHRIVGVAGDHCL